LLGADKGIASKAQDKINAKVGRDIVVGAHSPSFRFEKNEKECLEIIELINNSKATILAIGVWRTKTRKMDIYI
jgi:UDP-N-acetyl-D-mannosaminuronic acid transferase (WecB/TagA/CpsF family)